MSALALAIPVVAERTGRQVTVVGGLAVVCRLSRLSHAWAAATATPVTIRAAGFPDLAVDVAEPGALVAMKLQSVMNRGRAKEATDLLDIIRLCLDPVSGPTVLTALAHSEPQLREDACRRAGRWFDQQAERSLRLVRAVPEGQGIELDDLHLVGELLHNVLPVGGAEGI
ncbi:hypothetical protein AB0J82_34425 [Asanoa sp. NPDC049518]|uniref:hypothetical protein n=1 Tax=unclassified Asanoa TaxID=2685164 RepID=UPI0034151419